MANATEARKELLDRDIVRKMKHLHQSALLDSMQAMPDSGLTSNEYIFYTEALAYMGKLLEIAEGCLGDSFAADPAKWPHASQLEGMKHFAAECARCEELLKGESGLHESAPMSLRLTKLLAERNALRTEVDIARRLLTKLDGPKE